MPRGDGVEDDDDANDARLTFVELPIPTRSELEELTEKIARRITQLVEKLSEEESGQNLDETAAALQAALSKAMSAPTSVDQLSFAEQDHQGAANESRALCAKVAGFSLHAGQSARSDDRAGLERLCRYGLRAPFSQERLSLRRDGQVVYELSRPWPNSAGTTHLVLDPIELLQRLAALIPAPYTHLIRRHGVFASRSRFRWRLPDPPERFLSEGGEAPVLLRPVKETRGSSGDNSVADPKVESETNDPEHPKRFGYSWAQLLHRVFFLDAFLCHHCGSQMKVLSILTDPRVVGRILGHLGLATTAPPIHGSRESWDLGLWDGMESGGEGFESERAPP